MNVPRPRPFAVSLAVAGVLAGIAVGHATSAGATEPDTITVAWLMPASTSGEVTWPQELAGTVPECGTRWYQVDTYRYATPDERSLVDSITADGILTGPAEDGAAYLSHEIVQPAVPCEPDPEPTPAPEPTPDPEPTPTPEPTPEPQEPTWPSPSPSSPPSSPSVPQPSPSPAPPTPATPAPQPSTPSAAPLPPSSQPATPLPSSSASVDAPDTLPVTGSATTAGVIMAAAMIAAGAVAVLAHRIADRRARR